MEQQEENGHRKRKHSDLNPEDYPKAKQVKRLLLPASIFEAILSYLGIIDQGKFQRVSTMFLRLMPFSSVNLDDVWTRMIDKHLMTQTTRKVEQVLYYCSSHFPTNKCLTLRSDREDVHTTNRWRHMGLTFPNCQSLVMPQCSLQLNSLDHFPHLRDLDIDTLDVDTDVSPPRRSCTRVLQNMTMLACDQMSLTVLRTLANHWSSIPCLKKLRLKVSESLNPEDFPMIKQSCPNVASIHIICGEEEVDLKALSIFHGLRRLRLFDTPTFYRNVNQQNGVLPATLSRLTLEECDLHHFKFLEHLPNIRQLSLAKTGVSVTELWHLHKSAPLSQLELSYTDAISDALLQLLASRQYPIEELEVRSEQETARTRSFSSAALSRYLEGTSTLESLDVTFHKNLGNDVCHAYGVFLESLCLLDACNSGIDEKGIYLLHNQRNNRQVECSAELDRLTVRTTAKFKHSANMLEVMRLAGLVVQILTDEELRQEEEYH